MPDLGNPPSGGPSQPSGTCGTPEGRVPVDGTHQVSGWGGSNTRRGLPSTSSSAQSCLATFLSSRFFPLPASALPSVSLSGGRLFGHGERRCMLTVVAEVHPLHFPSLSLSLPPVLAFLRVIFHLHLARVVRPRQLVSPAVGSVVGEGLPKPGPLERGYASE